MVNSNAEGIAKGVGRAAEVHGCAVRPAAALPCLNTNNCNEDKLSSAHRKTAFALVRNVLWLIERNGVERIGFLTLTFARHVVEYKGAQKALHSLMTGVLRVRYPEYIIVMERMGSKRIHYHLLVVMAQDIRTGFDFAAVKSGDYRSASDYLRREWKFWRSTAPKYGFGRTELLPVRRTGKGIAKYIGKYVAKHIGQRLPEDKGARLVRYSRGAGRAGTRFDWDSQGGYMWRQKVGAFCQMLGLTSDNYKDHLREWFGRNWVYQLRPVIESIKPVGFFNGEESRASLQVAWIIAVNERERRLNRKGGKGVTEAKQSVLPSSWGSWIERTIKEDA